MFQGVICRAIQTLKKISAHITKKVADRLEEIFKDNRSDFESKWDDIGVFHQIRHDQRREVL
jgi:HSP90 family molecular chaperone